MADSYKYDFFNCSLCLWNWRRMYLHNYALSLKFAWHFNVHIALWRETISLVRNVLFHNDNGSSVILRKVSDNDCWVIFFYSDTFRCFFFYISQTVEIHKHNTLMSHKDGSCEQKHVAQRYTTLKCCVGRCISSVSSLHTDRDTHCYHTINRYVLVNTQLFVPCKMSSNVAKSIHQFRWQHRT